MSYSKDDCIKDTNLHKARVIYYIEEMAKKIMTRGLVHDNSKMNEPELAVFTEYTPKLKNSTYGSEEYKTFLKEMQVALENHYKANRHHPEHFTNGINGMNLIDLLEMFCDWIAATKRHDNGNIFKSIEYNKSRFNMSQQLVDIFNNTAELFEKINEEDDNIMKFGGNPGTKMK